MVNMLSIATAKDLRRPSRSLWRWGVFVCAVCASVPQTMYAQTSVLAGKVVDRQDTPLPGVTVTARGMLIERERSTLTDQAGMFSFGSVARPSASGLPPGAYLLTAELLGFAPVSVRVTVPRDGAVPPVTFVLSVEPFICRVPIARPLRERFADASIVAHIRVEFTAPPAKTCDRADEDLNAHHLVSVRSTAKGAPPTSLWVDEVDNGACWMDGHLVRLNESLFQPGHEYLVFLDPNGTSYWVDRMRFEIRGGRLKDMTYEPLKSGMTVREAFEVLRQGR